MGFIPSREAAEQITVKTYRQAIISQDDDNRPRTHQLESGNTRPVGKLLPSHPVRFFPTICRTSKMRTAIRWRH